MAETSQTDNPPDPHDEPAPTGGPGPDELAPPARQTTDEVFEHGRNYEPSLDELEWRPIRIGMVLWLLALVAMMWVFAKVMVLYGKAGDGEWVSLRDLRSTGSTGTAVFAVCLLLAGSFAHAVAAGVRGHKRLRRAGLALALASGLPLVLWVLLLVEASRGANPLGLR